MLRPIMRRVTTKGLRSSLVAVLSESRICLLHYKGVLKARRFRNCTDLRLQLGCGRKIKEGWLNVDLNGHADLCLDLRESLPFLSNSCTLIYSEHFLEHLNYPTEVMFLLEESYRILKPGGIFSVGVPDTEWPLRAYFDQEYTEYFRIAKERWHPKWCETRMDHINYHFRQGKEHCFAYDFETLKHVLTKAGFVEVRIRDYDPELDSEDRKLGSLYVDCRKAM